MAPRTMIGVGAHETIARTTGGAIPFDFGTKDGGTRVRDSDSPN